MQNANIPGLAFGLPRAGKNQNDPLRQSFSLPRRVKAGEASNLKCKNQSSGARHHNFTF